MVGTMDMINDNVSALYNVYHPTDIIHHHISHVMVGAMNKITYNMRSNINMLDLVSRLVNVNVNHQCQCELHVFDAYKLQIYISALIHVAERTNILV